MLDVQLLKKIRWGPSPNGCAGGPSSDGRRVATPMIGHPLLAWLVTLGTPRIARLAPLEGRSQQTKLRMSPLCHNVVNSIHKLFKKVITY